MVNYIGLPVNAGSSQQNLHMTVLFLGRKVPPVSVMNILNKYANYKTRLERLKVEQFDPKHIVARLNVPEDSWIRNLRDELIDAGIKDMSPFQPWNPHVTIPEFENNNPLDGLLDMHIPSYFTTYAPYVSLNGQRVYASPRNEPDPFDFN